MKCRRIAQFILVSSIGFTLLATSAAPALAADPHTHDGFFLRLSGGPGMALTSAKGDHITTEVFGAGGDYNVALGGALSENFILHASAWGWRLFDPTVKVSLGKLSAEDTMEDSTLGVNMLGLGATGYFGDNFYATASAGVALLVMEIDGERKESDTPGYGLDVALGKEWWVADHIGLGVAAAFGLHRIETEDKGNPPLMGTSFALRLSGTYN